jgi:hypothetical protein
MVVADHGEIERPRKGLYKLAETRIRVDATRFPNVVPLPSVVPKKRVGGGFVVPRVLVVFVPRTVGLSASPSRAAVARITLSISATARIREPLELVAHLARRRSSASTWGFKIPAGPGRERLRGDRSRNRPGVRVPGRCDASVLAVESTRPNWIVGAGKTAPQLSREERSEVCAWGCAIRAFLTALGRDDPLNQAVSA